MSIIKVVCGIIFKDHRALIWKLAPADIPIAKELIEKFKS